MPAYFVSSSRMLVWVRFFSFYCEDGPRNMRFFYSQFCIGICNLEKGFLGPILFNRRGQSAAS